MSASFDAFLHRMQQAIAGFLALLDESPVTSPDLAFLKTLLQNAMGYLQKDIAPDTEALENWDTPENQRMLRRYIRHLTTEIRMVVDDFPPGLQQEVAQQPLRQRMTTLLRSVEAEQQRLELLLQAQQHLTSNGDH